MGDRGNIVISMGAGAPPVYLYTHWGGSELPMVVSEALAKHWRWDDHAYLARIVFDQLTVANHGGETGYGIATYPADNEHDYLVLDPDKQEVRVVKYDREREAGPRHLDPLAGEVKAVFKFEQVAESAATLAGVFE